MSILAHPVGGKCECVEGILAHPVGGKCECVDGILAHPVGGKCEFVEGGTGVRVGDGVLDSNSGLSRLQKRPTGR